MPRFLWRAAFMSFIAAVLWVFQEDIGLARQRTKRFDDIKHARDETRLPEENPRCSDADDDDDETPTACKCKEPTKAVSGGSMWEAHHKRLVSYAMQQQKELDVVLLGDSITERWNGTRHMGQRGPYPQNLLVFQRYFDREAFPDQATVQGIALGSSGDTTNHMLRHLQNGLLPNNLRPKVWFLLTGTNNFGRDGCSKRNTLAGILNVLKVLQDARPHAQVIVHALLPRDDGPSQRFILGRMWKNIQFVNRELEKQCDLLPNCHFMDAGNIFFTTADNGGRKIQQALMNDGLHPSVDGYEAWAPKIVREVEKLLSKN